MSGGDPNDGDSYSAVIASRQAVELYYMKSVTVVWPTESQIVLSAASPSSRGVLLCRESNSSSASIFLPMKQRVPTRTCSRQVRVASGPLGERSVFAESLGRRMPVAERASVSGRSGDGLLERNRAARGRSGQAEDPFLARAAPVASSSMPTVDGQVGEERAWRREGAYGSLPNFTTYSSHSGASAYDGLMGDLSPPEEYVVSSPKEVEILERAYSFNGDEGAAEDIQTEAMKVDEQLNEALAQLETLSLDISNDEARDVMSHSTDGMQQLDDRKQRRAMRAKRRAARRSTSPSGTPPQAAAVGLHSPQQSAGDRSMFATSVQRHENEHSASGTALEWRSLWGDSTAGRADGVVSSSRRSARASQAHGRVKEQVSGDENKHGRQRRSKRTWGRCDVAVSRERPKAVRIGNGAMGAFLKGVGRHKLLTAQEEKELALVVQKKVKMDNTRRELQQELGRAPEPSEVLQALGVSAAEYRETMVQGEQAIKVLVDRNLRLVIAIGKRYAGSAMSLQDLVGEGILGLMRGVERYDPQKGFKVSTYVHWWIRQRMTRAMSEQSKVLKVPVHMHELLSKINKASAQLETELRRPPTMNEVADRCGMTLERLSQLKRAAMTPASLDAPLSADGDSATLQDHIPDEGSRSPDEEIVHHMLSLDMSQVLSTLSEREMGVLQMRYGLVDGREHTLEEVGKVYNVTRERIRQIESKALRKLRNPSRHSPLLEYSSQGLEQRQIHRRPGVHRS